MFGESKTVVCALFSKHKLVCALAVITGNKVDVIALDEIRLASDVIEEGIVYDLEYLSQVTKNLVASVSRSVKKIDAVWISIPDNKVKIANIQVPSIDGSPDQYELHKALEEKFQYTPSKLYLLSKPTHEINDYFFFLVYAIKPEHLTPYTRAFTSLNLKVESVFPTFENIYSELRNYFSMPTLLLYPYLKTGYKFLVADENGVYLDSIWGHNLIELNDNFDKAVEEIINFTLQNKEIALDVKKIFVIDSRKQDLEAIQIYLRRTRLDFAWIPSENYQHPGLDEVSLICLKGLLKNGAKARNPKGLLTENTVISEELDQNYLNKIKGIAYSNTPSYSLTKNYNNTQSTYEASLRNNPSYRAYVPPKNNTFKSTLISVILSIVLIILIGYTGWKITEKVIPMDENTQNENIISYLIRMYKSQVEGQKNTVTPTPTITSNTNDNATLTPTTHLSISPAYTPAPSPTQQVANPSPTPTLVQLTKSEVKVQVLNGNNRTGEARLVTGILQSNGFITKAPDNAIEKNIPTTSVKYKDKRAQQVSEEIVKLIEVRYPSAKAEYDPLINEDILVILGAN